MVYLVNSGQVVVKDGVVVEPVTEHDAEQLSTTSKESIKKSKRSTKVGQFSFEKLILLF